MEVGYSFEFLRRRVRTQLDGHHFEARMLRLAGPHRHARHAVLLLASQLAATASVEARPYAYVPNSESSNISVIDTATNTVTTTIALPGNVKPYGLAVSPTGDKVYLCLAGQLWIIATADYSLTTVPIDCGDTPVVSRDGSRGYSLVMGGLQVMDLTRNPVELLATIAHRDVVPFGIIAVSPDGVHAYIPDYVGKGVIVYDTRALATGFVALPVRKPLGVATHPVSGDLWVSHDADDFGVGTSGVTRIVDPAGQAQVGAPIPVPGCSYGITLSPDGNSVYTTSPCSDTVSRIDATSGSVGPIVAAGLGALGISITPDGSRVYVANHGSDNVSVFDANLAPVATVAVGSNPYAFGNFIPQGPQPADLTVAVVGDSPGRVGGHADFDVGVSNSGPGASGGSTTMSLGLDMAVNGLTVSTPSGWTCSPPATGTDNTTVTCAVASLAANSQAFFDIRVPLDDAMGGRTLTLSANVAGGVVDPVPGDNQDSATVQVTSSSDLRLATVNPRRPLRSNARTTITMKLENAGPNAAAAPVVTLATNLPASAVLLAAPAGWDCLADGNGMAAYSCRYSTYLAKGSTLFALDVSPPMSMLGRLLVLNGSVASTTSDPAPGNNSAVFKALILKGPGVIVPVVERVD